ncbi:haloacid dehalogenase type II [Mesorhizobium sp. M0598]|uniref:haloacid dehalogenase type II n=1 Tax=Mesorhizobium sp. M0598 TaxID=2956968 RepID=UPI00333BBB50
MISARSLTPQKKAGLQSPARCEGRKPSEGNAPDEWEETSDANCIWVGVGDVSMRSEESSMTTTRVLFFDVLGTVVDWRSGIAREAGAFLARNGVQQVDPGEFADAWASRYDASTEAVRTGHRPFVSLDVINRENLDATLVQFGLAPSELPTAELEELNLAWHRLEPWPDSLKGLARLKERFIIVPLSGANTRLLLDMAKRAGLPWDTVLGSDVFGTYKPAPQAYLRAVEILVVRPSEAVLVAAHNDDLAAARKCGIGTAFVARPKEHGPAQTTDLSPLESWDFLADDLVHLAQVLP